MARWILDTGVLIAGARGRLDMAALADIDNVALAAVAVHRQAPGGSPRNTVGVQVVGIEQQGELVRVRGRTTAGLTLAADITAPAAAALNLAVGLQVTFVIKAAEVNLYAA